MKPHFKQSYALFHRDPAHLFRYIGCLLRQELNLKYLITFTALKFNQPSYIREVLSFSSHESTLGLRSANDPRRLHEPRAIGERGFANRPFPYIALRLYNKLPITIKLINSLNTFKSHRKAFLFSRAYNQSGLTLQEIMHCKFLLFLLIIFLFFSFFSSACEFQLIERIGTQGKQNPDFIYMIIFTDFSAISAPISVVYSYLHVPYTNGSFLRIWCRLDPN